MPMEDSGSPAVQLLPASPGQLKKAAGYRGSVKECSACYRDFWVLAPSSGLGGGLTMEVPCPHCHGSTSEVDMTASEKPIFIQGIRRPWIRWKARSLGRALRRARSSLRIKSYRAVWRMKTMIGLSKSASSASGESPK